MAETSSSIDTDKATLEAAETKGKFLAHKQAMMSQVKSMLISLDPKAL